MQSASRGGESFCFLSHWERIKVREKLMSVRRARTFRKRRTDAEKRLWSCLPDRRLLGFKFRRQHPIGDRDLDLFCAEAKLAIELDGSGHFYDLRRQHDLDREIELYEKGIPVLRFRNSEVLENLDGVLNSIIYAIDPEKSLWAEPVIQKPSPRSSP
jgi:very-short-patch-repair endonuclease